MAEHQHGSMDITDHEKVFAGFVKVVSWTAVLVVVVLVFMALVNS